MPTTNEPDPWRDTFSSMVTFIIMLGLVSIILAVMLRLLIIPVWRWAL